MDLDVIIRKYALQNAIRYNGKANIGAVIGKVLQEDSSFKERIDEIKKKTAKIVSIINKIPLEKQHKELEQLAPELLEKKEREEKDIFAFLEIKPGQKVVTAFPPEPSKYPHIGHAKAIFLNHELARRNKGKFLLRFEDTNPRLAKKEYYDAHLDSYRWLGIEWDMLEYASDHMEDFYRCCRQLVEENNAYVCTCSQDEIKRSRLSSVACACRTSSARDNLKLWESMPGEEEGTAIVRLKIDLEHKNSAMRDPTIFRIIKASHSRLKQNYTLWPTYDFETAVMDGLQGVTHRLRSKEFEQRNELQRHIQNILGFKETYIYEFARFNMEGVESSGRIIREKIQNNEFIGWDDPALTTLVALKRRGFLPESIKGFVLSTGITKAEATLTWDDLIILNRRLLDKRCERYFFVSEPEKITIENAPGLKLQLKKHPEQPGMGYRALETSNEFYVEKRDADSLKTGELYRLMECLNFRKEKNKFVFDSLEYQGYKDKGSRIMHFLPVQQGLPKAEVFMPDHKKLEGIAEPGIKALKPGAQIQFERFGFVRLDSVENSVYRFWYTHQ